MVLLLFHTDPQGKELYFTSEPNKGKAQKIWDIKAIQQCLDIEVCRRLLFAHAILGCDTTSIGKGLSLNKLLGHDKSFEIAADTFLRISSKEDLVAAGKVAVVLLYGGDGKDLDSFRYQVFLRKVASANTYVDSSSLPPISAAAAYHIYRFYLQVQTWKDCSDLLSPVDWGWRVNEGVMYPIKTDLPPAPESILKVIKCGCKGTCSTARCTCKKTALNALRLVKTVKELAA